MNTNMWQTSTFQSLAEQLAAVGRWADQQGWTPATSSNLSARLDAHAAAITISGKHKGRLSATDIMVVDLDGAPLTPHKPSAETLLHTFLYRMDAHIGAVLHVHSLACVLVSQLYETAWRIEGQELQKAFEGVSTHEGALEIPIFANSQDIPQLAETVDARLKQGYAAPAYLIRGHGVYVWGADLEVAARHLEAIDFLARCELELRRLR
jgi:methylthioribulose-1-phosphate dehydratase